jgi:hypothetical protein
LSSESPSLPTASYRSASTTVQNLISKHILSDICHPKGGEKTITHALGFTKNTFKFNLLASTAQKYKW